MDTTFKTNKAVISALNVRAPSRIHICLSDMGNASFRRFGGIGFAVGGAFSTCRIEESEETEIVASKIEDPSCYDSIRYVVNCMAREFRLSNFRLTLLQNPPQHAGFGSMTTATLSSLVLVNEYFKLGLSASDLQIRSKRGGASGIGVHTFFHGGIIWDGGHQNSSSQLVPSRYAQRNTVPPLLARWEFPENWTVALIKIAGKQIFGIEEQIFFSQSSPVPASEALATIAAVCHGVIPAFKLQDLFLMREALREIHSVGFKKSEVQSQGRVVGEVLQKLWNGNIAAGMSSLGPLVYALVDRDDVSSRSRISEIAEELGNCDIEWTNGQNSGYSLDVSL